MVSLTWSLIVCPQGYGCNIRMLLLQLIRLRKMQNQIFDSNPDTFTLSGDFLVAAEIIVTSKHTRSGILTTNTTHIQCSLPAHICHSQSQALCSGSRYKSLVTCDTSSKYILNLKTQSQFHFAYCARSLTASQSACSDSLVSLCAVLTAARPGR